MKIQTAYLFLLFSSCVSSRTKVSDDGFSMNEVTLEDSVITKYYESYYPDIKLKHGIDTIQGKTILLTNYYKYYSFKNVFENTDTVTIINFGSYTTHTRQFMLITRQSETKKEQVFLGGGSYNEELLELNNFFQCLGEKVAEKDKIFITDLYLRCRRGQAKTPVYINKY